MIFSFLKDKGRKMKKERKKTEEYTNTHKIKPKVKETKQKSSTVYLSDSSEKCFSKVSHTHKYIYIYIYCVCVGVCAHEDICSEAIRECQALWSWSLIQFPAVWLE